MDKVIVDTSAWVESFRLANDQPLLDRDQHFDLIARKFPLRILRSQDDRY